jgi:hypothetical protein
VYTSDGQQAYASSGAQAYSSSGASITPVTDENGTPIPHGQLVYNHIRNDLNKLAGITATPIPVSAFPTPIPDEDIWLRPIDSWSINNDRLIYLFPVDTSNYKTTAVTERIKATVNTIYKTYRTQHFVLNMSFVIMPCDVAGEYFMDLITTTPELQDMEDAINGMYDSYQSGEPTQIAAVENDMRFLPTYGTVRMLYIYDLLKPKVGFVDPKFIPFIDDPLNTWLEHPTIKEPVDIYVISVASAGNYGDHGYNFPFAPAIWNKVVSVSANGWDPLNPEYQEKVFNPDIPYDGTKAFYSNFGEVMYDGKLNYPIKNQKLEDIYYFGTSFAAPEISVREALYLLNGGEVSCSENNRTSQPPLGYSEGYGPWDNLILATAVPRYCSDFPQNIPYP